jgi:hypothetical protein
MESEKNRNNTDYVIVRAGENGVTISAVPNENSPGEPPIRLDEGELIILHLNKNIRGYRIRGKVELITSLGIVEGHSSLIVGSAQGID